MMLGSDLSTQDDYSAKTPDGSPLWDRAGALQRVEGDEALLAELVQMFLEDCPRLMHELQESLSHKDARQLQYSAHALKGAVGNFGAEKVVASIHRMELLGKSGRIGEAETLFPVLKEEILNLQAALVV
jgi:HPt (histidine-containing phosphotransfer) domain-containing protein